MLLSRLRQAVDHCLQSTSVGFQVRLNRRGCIDRAYRAAVSEYNQLDGTDNDALVSAFAERLNELTEIIKTCDAQIREINHDLAAFDYDWSRNNHIRIALIKIIPELAQANYQDRALTEKEISQIIELVTVSYYVEKNRDTFSRENTCLHQLCVLLTKFAMKTSDTASDIIQAHSITPDVLGFLIKHPRFSKQFIEDMLEANRLTPAFLENFNNANCQAIDQAAVEFIEEYEDTFSLEDMAYWYATGVLTKNGINMLENKPHVCDMWLAAMDIAALPVHSRSTDKIVEFITRLNYRAKHYMEQYQRRHETTVDYAAVSPEVRQILVSYQDRQNGIIGRILNCMNIANARNWSLNQPAFTQNDYFALAEYAYIFATEKMLEIFALGTCINPNNFAALIDIAAKFESTPQKARQLIYKELISAGVNTSRVADYRHESVPVLAYIIRDAVHDYLMDICDPQTAEALAFALKTLQDVREFGIGVIWDRIRTDVFSRLLNLDPLEQVFLSELENKIAALEKNHHRKIPLKNDAEYRYRLMSSRAHYESCTNVLRATGLFQRSTLPTWAEEQLREQQQRQADQQMALVVYEPK